MKSYDPCVVGYVYKYRLFFGTGFLICSEWEIPTPLFLHLQILWVVMKQCTRDLLFLLSDLVWKQKVLPCDKHISQANYLLNGLKTASQRTLVLLSSWETCYGQAKAKGNTIWAPPTSPQQGEHQGTHFRDTKTQLKSPNAIKALIVCTF